MITGGAHTLLLCGSLYILDYKSEKMMKKRNPVPRTMAAMLTMIDMFLIEIDLERGIL